MRRVFSVKGHKRKPAAARFMDMELGRKVVVIYLIAVLLPTLGLGVGVYQMNLKALENSYYDNQKNVITSAKENLTIQLNQVAAAYNFFQQSETLMNLLAGMYTDVSNTLFYYIRDVSPLLKAARVNPNIERVGIFGFNDYALNMENGLASIKALDLDPSFLEEIRTSGGLWRFLSSGKDNELYYYRMLTKNTYPYETGLVVFKVNMEALMKTLCQQVSNPVFLESEDGSLTGYDGKKMFTCAEMEEEPDSNGDQICRFVVAEGFPQILIPIEPMRKIQMQGVLILLALTVLLFVFTLLYFFLSSSITGRLKAFAQYLRNSDEENLVPFDSHGYQDEVGVVIASYNELLERTNNLIHENLKSQIQKRESDYYALQAQIQPHFLYNILENIRMNAEANHDPVTADMLLSLGKHMRYNLNMSSRPVSLEDELYFSKNYLQIHKIRMKEKMRFEVLISAEIDGISCPRFLLQPLLENAIRHGYSLDRQLFVWIWVLDGKECGDSNGVKIVIGDDGNGIEPDRLRILQDQLLRKEVEEAHHVGLLNVNSRLSSFCGKKEGCIRIDSRPGEGTEIMFYLWKSDEREIKQGGYDEDIDCGR